MRGIKGEFHEIIWNVSGIDQHAQEIDFDMACLEDAEWHKERFDRLGGSVKITKMKFNAPAATWLEVKND